MEPEPEESRTEFGVLTKEEAEKRDNRDHPEDIMPPTQELLEYTEEQLDWTDRRLERATEVLTIFKENEDCCYSCQEELTGTDMEGGFRLCGTKELDVDSQPEGCNGLLCTRCAPKMLMRYGSTCPYWRSDGFPGFRDELQELERLRNIQARAPAPEPAPAAAPERAAAAAPERAPAAAPERAPAAAPEPAPAAAPERGHLFQADAVRHKQSMTSSIFTEICDTYWWWKFNLQVAWRCGKTALLQRALDTDVEVTHAPTTSPIPRRSLICSL